MGGTTGGVSYWLRKCWIGEESEEKDPPYNPPFGGMANTQSPHGGDYRGG